MKKDSYTIGIGLVFIAFFLMIGIFVFENWKLGKTRELLQSVQGDQPEVVLEERDYSQFPVLSGDDGGEMVLIPGGHFSMGSPPGEGGPDEIPQRVVFVSSFYIDFYEVTHAMFLSFVKATKAPKPVVPYFEEDLSFISKPEQPVVGVTWVQSKQYCEWAGKRLPTEAEWEMAARGERALKWPWGNIFWEKLSNVEGEVDGFKYSAPPGRFEMSRSPFGVFDMAGNVSEWVADWYDADFYQEGVFRNPKGPRKGKYRSIRGGSWNDSASGVRTAKRFPAAPHQAGFAIGFRCAMSKPV